MSGENGSAGFQPINLPCLSSSYCSPTLYGHFGGFGGNDFLSIFTSCIPTVDQSVPVPDLFGTPALTSIVCNPV